MASPRRRTASAPEPLCAAHFGDLPKDQLLPQSLTFLDLANTKPVILAGAMGSGKSTTANSILGENILPTGPSMSQRSVWLIHNPQAPPGGDVKVSLWQYDPEADQFACNSDVLESVPRNQVKQRLSSLCGFYSRNLPKDQMEPFVNGIVILFAYFEPLKNNSLVDLPGLSILKSEEPMRRFNQLLQDRLKSSAPKYIFVYDSGRWGPTELEGLYPIKNFIDPENPGSVLFFHSKVDFMSHYYDCGGKVSKEYQKWIRDENFGHLKAVLEKNKIFRDSDPDSDLKFLSASALDVYLPDTFFEKISEPMNELRQQTSNETRTAFYRWLQLD